MQTIFWLLALVYILSELIILAVFSSFRESCEFYAKQGKILKEKPESVTKEEKTNLMMWVLFAILLLTIEWAMLLLGLFTNQWLGFIVLIAVNIIGFMFSKLNGGFLPKSISLIVHWFSVLLVGFLLINDVHLKIDLLHLIGLR